MNKLGKVDVFVLGLAIFGGITAGSFPLVSLICILSFLAFGLGRMIWSLLRKK
jgi:hypothetical protein